MKRTQPADQPLAALFGGTWMPLPIAGPGEELKAAADVARGEGGSHFVLVQSNHEVMVGSSNGKFTASTRLAGQLLASVVGADAICTLAATDVPQPNMLRTHTMMFLGEHGEQRVVVAVLNGLPVIDFVGTLEEVLAQAHNFMEKIVGGGGGALLIQQSVATEFERERNSAPAATRFVEALPFDAQWRTRTEALRAVGISRARLLLFGAGLLLVGLPGSYTGYSMWERRRLEIEAAERHAFEKANASKLLERMQADALGVVTLAQALPAGVMAFDFARKLMDERGGFSLEKLQLTPKESLATYARRNRSRTFTDFVSQAEGGTPSFDVSKLDLGNVIYDALPWQNVQALNLSDPAHGSEALLSMGTLAQRVDAVGVKLAISPATAVLTSEQLDRVDRPTLAAIGRKAGSWTATGPVDLFVPLMEAMPSKACTLSQVEFRWARDPKGIPSDTFEASGRWIVGWM
jgi:hypothetical protein